MSGYSKAPLGVGEPKSQKVSYGQGVNSLTEEYSQRNYSWGDPPRAPIELHCIASSGAVNVKKIK